VDSVTKRVPSTDFGNKEWNLLFSKFWFAMEICEIIALGCKLAKQPLVGGHGQRSQIFWLRIIYCYFLCTFYLFKYVRIQRQTRLFNNYLFTCIRGLLVSLYCTHALLLFIPCSFTILATV